MKITNKYTQNVCQTNPGFNHKIESKCVNNSADDSTSSAIRSDASTYVLV